MTDVWDSFTASNGGGDYPEPFRFSTIGASIAGTITNVRPFTYEGKTSPDIWIETDDGERSVICSQFNLRNKLIELRPIVGDRIAIKYTGDEKMGQGKTAKKFDIAVKRADGSTVDPAPEKATSAADLL